MFRKKVAVTSVVLAAAMIAGCGGQNEGSSKGAAPGTEQAAKNQQTPPQPVTLKFYTRTVLDDFEKYVNSFVAKKFPHVTLELIKAEKGRMIEDLIAAGDMPDIIWEGLTNIQQITALNVPQDLTPYAKKHGLDLTQFKPGLMTNIKAYSEKGELYFLPYNEFVVVAQYNKDIFDMFGVSYLKDNMTWEEMIQVASRMTAERDGIKYRGIKTGGLNRVSNQMSLSYVDPKTGKSLLQNDEWKKLFEFYRSALDVPGQAMATSLTGGRTEYLNRTLAIFPDHLQLQNTDMVAEEKKGLNWDVVTYPTFKDKPGVGLTGFADGFVIPNGTKNADIAFQIAAYLAADPEVQMEKTKHGRVTAVNDKKYFDHAFEYNPAAKGKNLKNIFNYTAPAPGAFTKYDTTGAAAVNKYLLQYVQGKDDVNTLLRKAEEEHTKAIAEINAR